MTKDMRSWISQLEETGELTRITDEVNLEYEMAERLANSTDKALLFINIKGHPKWQVLGQAPANMKQVGIAFETEREKVNATYVSRLEKGLTTPR